MGLDFIDTNHKEDNWFLQIETFDPHEPFFSYQKYKDLYPHSYNGPQFDWPKYNKVEETPEQVQHCRYEYAALVSMCDNYLGKVLDKMDEYNLWQDTMLIVNTDHGFLLGEHDWWAKCIQPFYNEVAHIPLFIWDPRSGRRGERCDCLVQTIDLAPTLLDFFKIEIPRDMQGKPLGNTIANNTPIHDAVLFGVHGGHVNCTDGRYVYMRAPITSNNQPLYNYTLMPTHMRSMFSIEELKTVELAEAFPFTKGCKTMRIQTKPFQGVNAYRFGTLLYDLKNDPQQENPISNTKIEEMMIQHMITLMKKNHAPIEQYERLGLC